MSELPSIKQILHTASGIRDKPIETDQDVELADAALRVVVAQAKLDEALYWDDLRCSPDLNSVAKLFMCCDRVAGIRAELAAAKKALEGEQAGQ